MLAGKFSFNKVRSIFFFSLLLLFFFLFFYIVWPLFFTTLWAAIIAIMFYPMFGWVDKHIKLPSASALISLILVIVFLVLPLSLVAVLLVQQSIEVYTSIANVDFVGNAQGIIAWVEGSQFAPYLQQFETQWQEYAGNAARNFAEFVIGNITSVTQNAATFIALVVIMFYLLYYFFRDGKKILNKVTEISPLGNKYEHLMYERFREITAATLKSTLIIGGMQGAIGGILFAITGIAGSLIWAIIMMALSIVPAIGPTLVWVPAGVYMLVTGQIWQGVVILVGGTFLSTIDNFIRPSLIGKDAEMHPIIAFLSTLGGIATLGISGFIIGPIIAAMFLSILSIYTHYYRHELDNN